MGECYIIERFIGAIVQLSDYIELLAYSGNLW